jgi:hypothetical protein
MFATGDDIIDHRITMKSRIDDDGRRTSRSE